MKQQLEAVLSGSDSSIDGIASQLDFDGYQNAWEFKSIDNSLNLVIAKDDKGNWHRIAGTEPYLSGWVHELADQIV